MIETKKLEKILAKIRLNKINPRLASEEIQRFIVDTVVSAGKSGGVIGLSGGIDSTTVAYLAKKAFDKYNEENSEKNSLKLYGLIMPAKANREVDTQDGIRVAELLGVEYDIVEIQPLADVFIHVRPGKIEGTFHRGNLSSEMRAIVLSREAAARNVLVLGTGNRDEDYCLGYFTKRGDGSVDLSPIGNLHKRQVRQVAKHLGVPEYLINRISTAGLYEGQTDEGDLGFSYLEAEIIVAGKDQGYTREELEMITEFGSARKADEKNTTIVNKVLDMHEANKFKMEMPPVANINCYWGGNLDGYF